MALTEIPIELSSTPSIVDGGNATAITIDSSENVGVGAAPIGTGLNIKANGSGYTDGALSLTDSDSDTRTYLTHVNGIFAVSTNNGAADGITMSGAGEVTMPYQPAFLAKPASVQSNIAANNTEVTVAFGSEIFDQGGNFANNTFTAPLTGRYQLNLQLYITTLDSASDYYVGAIRTSNRIYYFVLDPNFSGDLDYWTFPVTALADMDAGDTAHVFIQQQGGTAQTDITVTTFFSGFLAA